jgi:hypothetical protein
MSDWQVGDAALCVTVTHPAFVTQSSILRVGAIYTVVKVGRPIERMGGERALGLAEACPRNAGNGFPETLFRKLEPHAPDAFDLSVIEQMTGASVEVVG